MHGIYPKSPPILLSPPKLNNLTGFWKLFWILSISIYPTIYLIGIY